MNVSAISPGSVIKVSRKTHTEIKHFFSWPDSEKHIEDDPRNNRMQHTENSVFTLIDEMMLQGNTRIVRVISGVGGLRYFYAYAVDITILSEP